MLSANDGFFHFLLGGTRSPVHDRCFSSGGESSNTWTDFRVPSCALKFCPALERWWLLSVDSIWRQESPLRSQLLTANCLTPGWQALSSENVMILILSQMASTTCHFERKLTPYKTGSDNLREIAICKLFRPSCCVTVSLATAMLMCEVLSSRVTAVKGVSVFFKVERENDQICCATSLHD